MMHSKELVAETISKQLGVGCERVRELLEVPPDEKLGDYAMPCFSFAKELKKAPPVIAQEFAQKLSSKDFSVEVSGPYLNIRLERQRLAKRVLTAAREENYGKGSQGERVMVEFSQPNTHKAFHAGHLRGTSMGEALARILSFAGWDVVRANYSGDTGMHVARWLWCYTRFHAGEQPPKQGRGAWLASIYVDAMRRLAEQPALQEEADKINLALDKGEDEELMALWRKTRQWSIDEFEAIYRELDTHFDIWIFEREVEARAREVAQELLAKGIAEKSDGAVIVNLEEEGLGVWVLLRQDGTPLYSAKDLALAEKKFTEHKIDRAIYVVGKDQELYFKQLFTTLKRWGFSQAERCFHLCFEMVRLPDGKMSSRTGKNILYTDVRDEVFAYTEEQIRARHADWPEEKIRETVHAVGVCALKFEMIVRDINKSIIFETKRVCDFEGDTGPYVQYTHARCNSILRKLGRAPDMRRAVFSSLSESEYRLVKELERFPSIISEVATSLEPAPLARYALALAKAFNTFYHECKVIGAEQGVEDARALLVDATRLVLARALTLLGIKAPKEM
ncbi:arginine--tRNA ligase [Candidatus Woesearchaeota archaeon]|nr:MAG: arginine--tRNA ligase [Candidatus Woesearchaeota archaeon]